MRKAVASEKRNRPSLQSTLISLGDRLHHRHSAFWVGLYSSTRPHKFWLVARGYTVSP